MNYLIHPKTGQKISLFSKGGKHLLKQMIQSYNYLKQHGGMNNNNNNNNNNNTPEINAKINNIINLINYNEEFDNYEDNLNVLQEMFDNNQITETEFNKELDNILDDINDYEEGTNFYNNPEDLEDLINNSTSL